MSNNLPQIISDERSSAVPIHVYQSHYSKNSIDSYRWLAQLEHVTAPIILLPDVHFKPKLETPSSSVIATEGYFSLTLTSPSQNCGMNLMLTQLHRRDITPAFLNKFFSEFKRRIPLNRSNAVLSSHDVLLALKDGARWAVDAFNLSDQILRHIELDGNINAAANVSINDIKTAVPNNIIDISCYRFGLLGGGNHFLEFQVVEDILDKRTADLWNISDGQMVIMLHTGSDYLGGYLGRLYAYRRKTSLRHQLYFYRKKLSWHSKNINWNSLIRRCSYYLLPTPYRFIDPATDDGKQALLSINCAANFGFASRLFIFHHIKKIYESLLNNIAGQLSLLYDCSHNSIYFETINQKPVWVHRHNACRAYPKSQMKSHPVFSQTGQPVLLPGTNQTSSFICAAEEGAVATHYSVDHGLGAIQARNAQIDSDSEFSDQTLLFNYTSDEPTTIFKTSDLHIQNAIDTLSHANIIRPVIRLAPVATFKGLKSRIV